MIVDTSAVVAIMLRGPGFDGLLHKLSVDPSPAIGAPTMAETGIVLSARLRKDARALLSRFLTEASVEVVVFGEMHFGAAVDAWLRYGKGRHPAALNFGDCMSYALARVADTALLCIGEDFPKTDIAIA